MKANEASEIFETTDFKLVNEKLKENFSLYKVYSKQTDENHVLIAYVLIK